MQSQANVQNYGYLPLMFNPYFSQFHPFQTGSLHSYQNYNYGVQPYFMMPIPTVQPNYSSHLSSHPAFNIFPQQALYGSVTIKEER